MSDSKAKYEKAVRNPKVKNVKPEKAVKGVKLKVGGEGQNAIVETK